LPLRQGEFSILEDKVFVGTATASKLKQGNYHSERSRESGSR
jgi:hypothetical protein